MLWLLRLRSGFAADLPKKIRLIAAATVLFIALQHQPMPLSI
jgi:hypothetical protein